jgi:hypothetical protein
MEEYSCISLRRIADSIPVSGSRRELAEPDRRTISANVTHDTVVEDLNWRRFCAGPSYDCRQTGLVHL